VVVTKTEVVEDLCHVLELPSDMCEKAKQLLSVADMSGVTKSFSSKVIAAGVVIATCKDVCYPLAAHVVLKVADADGYRTFMFLRRLADAARLKLYTPPQCYARKIAELLKLGEKETKTAEEICGKAQMLGIADGRDPIALAAACIYIAYRLINGWDTKLTQPLLSKLTGCSEVTIRKRIREIATALSISIPMY